MAFNSRNKGRVGENEIIALLQPLVDKVCAEVNCARFELIREPRQRFEKKHYDIFGLPWAAIEVKRVEQQGQLGQWWRQCLASAKEGQIPILLYRPNYSPWRVRMRVPIHVVKGTRVRMDVNVSWEDFLVWFECRLRAELAPRR